MLEHAKKYYESLSQEETNKIDQDLEKNKEIVNKIFTAAKETHLYKDSDIEPNIIDIVLTFASFAPLTVPQIRQMKTPAFCDMVDNLKIFFETTDMKYVYDNLINYYLVK